jgi:xanthine dehydrogenase small subunit
MKVPALSSFHDEEVLIRDFRALSQTVAFGAAGGEVFLPGELAEALRLKRQHPEARIVSGMTDLGVLTNKGKLPPGQRIALHQIEELGRMEMGSDAILVGARVTLSELEDALETDFPEFSKLLRIFASPQIKHSATLAGNLMNASPIGDTPPFLRAAEATVILSRWGQSGSIERREVPIDHFIKGGYKELDAGKDEILTAIRIPRSDHRYALFKTSTRKDLDISTVTFAARYRLANGKLEGMRIVYGGVGPSVLRFEDLEAMLEGQAPDPALFTRVADLSQTRVSPLSDVRGSATFRKVLVRNLMLKFGDRMLIEAGASNREALV